MAFLRVLLYQFMFCSACAHIAQRTTSSPTTQDLHLRQVTPTPSYPYPYPIILPSECGSLCSSCVQSKSSVLVQEIDPTITDPRIYSSLFQSEVLCHRAYMTCLSYITSMPLWSQFATWIDQDCASVSPTWPAAANKTFSPLWNLMMPEYATACASSLLTKTGIGLSLYDCKFLDAYDGALEDMSCACSTIPPCSKTRSLRADTLSMQYWSTLYCSSFMQELTRIGPYTP